MVTARPGLEVQDCRSQFSLAGGSVPLSEEHVGWVLPPWEAATCPLCVLRRCFNRLQCIH